jgi:DNA-directed RNA polymerase subunit beta'
VLLLPDEYAVVQAMAARLQEHQLAMRLLADGDHVELGQQLMEGAADPHEVLRVMGPRQVQIHLVNEIQEVYRLQGVNINDKHIEVIVRQMLQKVDIVDPGDTGAWK